MARSRRKTFATCAVRFIKAAYKYSLLLLRSSSFQLGVEKSTPNWLLPRSVTGRITDPPWTVTPAARATIAIASGLCRFDRVAV